METHAGAGFYRLDSPEARRSKEAETGLERLVDVSPACDGLLRYVTIVAALPENHAGLVACPGSPLVAAGLLGEDDRLLLCEASETEAAALRRLLRHDQRAAVHCRDGWEALDGLLPPMPRRGLLLVDPPYEAASDLDRVADGLARTGERWPEGVLAAWYPIKDRRELAGFRRRLAGFAAPVLACELAVRPDDNSAGLNGSGLVVVAPPWRFEADARPLQEELARLLCPRGAHRQTVEWITPPQNGSQ
jgi:23S rRNA (adenine2030-N6)-methyltransferase